MRIIDAWLAFPFLLFAIAVVAILGPGLRNVIIALIASEWVLYVRLVRGETLSLREREFVASARMLGVRDSAIMIKHILPNTFAPIMVVATLEIGVVIVTEASLSFLGLGVDAATPTWARCSPMVRPMSPRRGGSPCCPACSSSSSSSQ